MMIYLLIKGKGLCFQGQEDLISIPIALYLIVSKEVMMYSLTLIVSTQGVMGFVKVFFY